MKEELLKDVEEGETIKIIKGEREYSGILMPHHRFSGEDVVTLKLKNGYNIGVRVDSDTVVRSLKQEERRGRPEEQVSIDEDKPKVSILGTGGTIASYVEYRTGAVFPAQSEEDILYSNPEIAERCNPSLEIMYSKLSEDLTPSDWVNIANRVMDELNSGAEGVVIAHGTDIMGYTSAALSFLLDKLPKPVVLVGSQRSSDRPSSDAHLNLLAAVEVAKADLSGVYLVMHDDINDDRCAIHPGTKVRKMHTSRRDAFESINTDEVGFVDPRSGEVTVDIDKSRGEGEVTREGSMDPDVSLVYVSPGLSEEELEAAGERDGVVIAGTGLGHIGSKYIPIIEDMIDEGTPVVMTSQCLHGRVNDYIYSNGRKLLDAGVIPGGDMLPETALVKLMWALTLDDDTEEIMKTNIAGELTERRVR